MSYLNNNTFSSTTFILGAGFSKNAGIPLQSEFSELLLSNQFDGRIDLVITKAIKSYLSDVFGWQEGDDLPSLEDIFTCIDLSASTGHTLGPNYSPKVLRALRRFLIYRVLSILNYRYKESDDISELLSKFYKNDSECRCSFIVLNWDIILEKHLKALDPSLKINYCSPCYDWHSPNLPLEHDGVPICKMHGSSNWVYCDNCKSTFFDLDRKLSLYLKSGIDKSDLQLFDEKIADTINLPENRKCKFCEYPLSSHIATFSYRKSFRTAIYPSVWYHAEKLLSESNRWVFIGYSLPEADYEFKHLLKSAQLKTLNGYSDNKKIDVVVRKDKQARKKFGGFFGPRNIRFYNEGLSEYISLQD